MDNRPKCRTCEKPLRPTFEEYDQYQDAPSLLGGGTDRTLVHVVNRKKVIRWGYSADGFFCSLRCGHTFAVATIRVEEQRKAKRGAR